MSKLPKEKLLDLVAKKAFKQTPKEQQIVMVKEKAAVLGIPEEEAMSIYSGEPSPYMGDIAEARKQHIAITKEEEEREKKRCKQFFDNFDNNFLEANPHLVALLRGDNVYMYEYNEAGYYTEVLKKQLRSKVDAMLKSERLLDYRARNAISDLVESIENTLMNTPERLMKTPEKYLLNLKNGLFDPETRTLSPHDPSYFSTAQVPVSYEQDADPTEFVAMLDKYFGDPDANDRLQEIIGYMLLDGNPHHKIFYFYGATARNGKSTLAKVIMSLLGSNNCASLSVKQLERAFDNSSQFEVLIGKQLNYSDELNDKYITSDSLTTLSAENEVTVNPKYMSQYQAVIKSKFLVTCNSLPRFSNAAGAHARMVALTFPNQIPQQERIVHYEKKIIEQHGSAILRWALDGLDRLKKNNFVFTASAASTEDMEDNLLLNEPAIDYIQQYFEIGEGELTITEMFGKKAINRAGSYVEAVGYHKFCEEENIHVSAFKTFSASVNKYLSKNTTYGKVRRDNVRYVSGIKWKRPPHYEIEEEINNKFKAF